MADTRLGQLTAFYNGTAGNYNLLGAVNQNVYHLRYELQIGDESGTELAFQIGGTGDTKPIYWFSQGDLDSQEGFEERLNDQLRFRCAISEDENAYISLDAAPRDYVLTVAKHPNGGAQYFVKCDGVIHDLYPGKMYYLWLYPIPHYDGTTEYSWGTLGWGDGLAETLTLSGVAATYTVDYDANGGSGKPAAQTKYHGEDLVLSGTVPTRKGHSFLGWATSANGEAAYQPGDAYATDAAVTLYAVWKVNQYTDTFDPNGGTGGGSFTGDYGSSYQAPNAKRAGYLISGWWTAKTGGSKVANPGQTITHNASNDTAYAQWNERTYMVDFDPNGGIFLGSDRVEQLTTKMHSDSIASVGPAEKGITTEEWTVILDAAGGSCPAEKVVSGGTVAHTFIGWYDQQGNRVYDENGNCVEGICWQEGKWIYDDDLQLSAWYRKEPVEFAPVELPKPERAGYRFRGWATDPQNQEVVSGSYVPQGESVTLYAVWEALVLDVARAQALVYARGRFRPYRVLIGGKPYMLRLETRPTPLTVTYDGNGKVTLHGDISAVYDGAGKVRITGTVTAKYADGKVTIKGGTR